MTTTYTFAAADHAVKVTNTLGYEAMWPPTTTIKNTQNDPITGKPNIVLTAPPNLTMTIKLDEFGTPTGTVDQVITGLNALFGAAYDS